LEISKFFQVQSQRKSQNLKTLTGPRHATVIQFCRFFVSALSRWQCLCEIWHRFAGRFEAIRFGSVWGGTARTDRAANWLETGWRPRPGQHAFCNCLIA